MVERNHHSKAQTLKSLDLGLRVLESFGYGRSERGVTELAKKFGVSKATIYRVLATLERRDYVVQNPSNNRYQLGPIARRLYPRSIFLVRRVRTWISCVTTSGKRFT